MASWGVSGPLPPSEPAPAATAAGYLVPVTRTPPLEIEREAARLEARMRREKAYAQPRRDPFRFGADRAGDQVGMALPGDTNVVPSVPVSQLSPLLSLAGVGEDQVDDLSGQRIERMAVLSAPSGVLLVREGDDVLGVYRVVTIESEAVELERADGTTLRVGFIP